MNTTPRNSDLKSRKGNPVSDKTWMPALNLLGHAVGLARDVSELQSCLALEGAASSHSSAIPSLTTDSDGLESPSAVPYCDFLMVRDSAGNLAGMARLLAHGRDIPVRHPLSNSRFQLSPLLTAIRYSRLDMVEVGPLLVAPGRDPGRIMALLWRGILRYLERSGASILLGRERLDLETQSAAVPYLRAVYGLHPDLELEARASFRLQGQAAASRGGRTPASHDLPAGLQEALDRGCRLAGEPILNADRNALDLIWVAFREMLNPNGEDWSRDSAGLRPAV